MYRFNKHKPSLPKIDNSYEGETIEQKVNRIVNNKEPISDGAPLIYTDRKDGVQPQYDIRADKWDIAIDAMDKVSQSHVDKREMAIGERTYDTMKPEAQEAFNKKYPNNKHAQAAAKQNNQPGQNPA